jgi:hypothetical protein
MVEVSALIDPDMLVEIEADAVIAARTTRRRRPSGATRSERKRTPRGRS